MATRYAVMLGKYRRVCNSMADAMALVRWFGYGTIEEYAPAGK